jgi:L-alanine-DL-glutamate epimerase-like enolase superfamily enzyme
LIAALSGLDIALWDIAGQATGLPIYKLLGAAHDSLPAYGSAGFYEEGKGLGELRAEIEGLVEQGFRSV